MRRGPVQLMRDFAILIAVLVGGSAVGLGLGFALGGFGEDEAKNTIARTPDRSGSNGSSEDTNAEIQLADGVRLVITGASFRAATTASGRKRKRGRVALLVRLRNGSGTSIPAFPGGPGARLRVVVGAKRVAADPRATTAADGLARRLAPESVASGELRFETAGSATTALTDATVVRVRLGGRAVDVPLD